MDRETARQGELAILIVIGLFGLVVTVVAAALSVRWGAVPLIAALMLLGVCLGAPVYAAWLLWFLVRAARDPRSREWDEE